MSGPITIPGKGTQLKKGGAAIALVTEIDGPDMENPSRETVHLGSTWRTKRATIPDGGDLTFKAYLTAANAADLYADFVAGTESTYAIVFPADDAGASVTTSPTFKAYPSKVKYSGMANADTVIQEVTLTVTDSVTLGA